MLNVDEAICKEILQDRINALELEVEALKKALYWARYEVYSEYGPLLGKSFEDGLEDIKKEIKEI
jgi:hypothetical protein